MLLAVHYRVMEHAGSLESTKEARVALGYRLGQLLRPVQTVMIVDDSFNYHARLNTNYHSLSSTITNYHAVWTCSNSA